MYRELVDSGFGMSRTMVIGPFTDRLLGSQKKFTVLSVALGAVLAWLWLYQLIVISCSDFFVADHFEELLGKLEILAYWFVGCLLVAGWLIGSVKRFTSFSLSLA